MDISIFLAVFAALLGICIFLEAFKMKRPHSVPSQVKAAQYELESSYFGQSSSEPEIIVLPKGGKVVIPQNFDIIRKRHSFGRFQRRKIKVKCSADADIKYIPVIIDSIGEYFALHSQGVKSKLLERVVRYILRTILEWLCKRNDLPIYKQFRLSQLLGHVYSSERDVLQPCYAQIRKWCDKFYSADLFKRRLQPDDFVEFKPFIVGFLHDIKGTSSKLKLSLEEKYPIQNLPIKPEYPKFEIPLSQQTIQPFTMVKSLDHHSTSSDEPERKILSIPTHQNCPKCDTSILLNKTGPLKCPHCNFFPDRLELGYLLDENGNIIGHFLYPLEAQKKHESVYGVSGSGKSTYIKIKTTALREHGIGVLTFQCAGRDSREHINVEIANPKGIKDTLIFTPGIEDLCPMRFNPLAIPRYQNRKARVQTHIEHFAAIFTFAYDLAPPFPGLIREALQKIYERKGWDITNNSEPQTTEFMYPRPIELIPAVEECLAGRYSNKIRDDLKGVLRTRLKDINRHGFGKMFNCKNSISFDELLEKNVVFELDQLEDNTKRLFVGLFLTSFCEFLQIKGAHGKLNHVIIIEEAHRVLSRDQIGQDGSVMAAKTNEVITNALAEFRKLGEGLIIITQDPNRLPETILKLPQTATILQLKDEVSIQTITRYFLKFQRFLHQSFPLLNLKIGEAYVITPSANDLNHVQFFQFPQGQDTEVPDDVIKLFMQETYYHAQPWLLKMDDPDYLENELFNAPSNGEITDYRDLFLGIELQGVDITCAKLEFKFLIRNSTLNQPFQKSDYRLDEYSKRLLDAEFEVPSVQKKIRELQLRLTTFTPSELSETALSNFLQQIHSFAIQRITPPIRFSAFMYFLRVLMFKYLKSNTIPPVELYRHIIRHLARNLPDLVELNSNKITMEA